jgi:hypothetical protein
MFSFFQVDWKSKIATIAGQSLTNDLWENVLKLFLSETIIPFIQNICFLLIDDPQIGP